MRLRMLAALAALLWIGLDAAGSAAAEGSQTLFRPVAVVNDQAITGYDLAQRAQILLALGYQAASPDQLRQDALDQLIDDRLKLQAAKQMGIEVTPDMIADDIDDLARRAGMKPDTFRALLNNQGVSDQALEDLAKADIAWIKVVRARFSNRVEPGQAEIDSELALVGKQGATQYRVLEIGLPFDDKGRGEADTRALAERLSRQLNDGGDFAAAVARYSRAPSAARGGEVGWVSIARMPEDLRQALEQLNVGEVSRPLPVSGGLELIKLVDKRTSDGGAADADDQTREAVRNSLVNRRSARLAEGLLQEMRRDALIEVR